MRITGGRYRGRIAACPSGIIRPAMDRMRESLFSILGDIHGLSFLDLFAGSGIMALEALSRGAKKALLVEKDGKKRSVILKNLEIAAEDSRQARSMLRIQSVESFLREGMERFDLVFLDPPFAMKKKERLLELAEKADQPAKGGVLVLHYPFKDTLPCRFTELEFCDKRRYGQSRLIFYTRND